MLISADVNRDDFTGCGLAVQGNGNAVRQNHVAAVGARDFQPMQAEKQQQKNKDRFDGWIMNDSPHSDKPAYWSDKNTSVW
jgi:hypothetical protein